VRFPTGRKRVEALRRARGPEGWRADIFAGQNLRKGLKGGMWAIGKARKPRKSRPSTPHPIPAWASGHPATSAWRSGGSCLSPSAASPGSEGALTPGKGFEPMSAAAARRRGGAICAARVLAHWRSFSGCIMICSRVVKSRPQPAFEHRRSRKGPRVSVTTVRAPHCGQHMVFAPFAGR
jgi:hypothetical protein